MDEKNKSALVSIAMLIVLFSSITFLAGRLQLEKHENVHSQICKYFGGIPNITYSNFGLKGKTSCDPNGMSTEDWRMKAVGDSFNEAVEYQLQPIFMLIVVFSFFICLFLMMMIELR